MNNAIKMTRLDFVTIKPYMTLKNLAILLAVALIMVFNSADGSGAAINALMIGIIMMFGVIYSSYPFMVGEKNGIDSLYFTLSIPSVTIVLGRYLFALSMQVLAAFTGSAISLVIAVATKNPLIWSELGAALLGIFAVMSVIQAIQLPIYFKYSYAKAKFVTYIPLFGFPIFMLALSGLARRLGQNWFAGALAWVTANPAAVGIIAAVLWCCAVVVSYRISVRAYGKREF
jgi:hypothetical protein